MKKYSFSLLLLLLTALAAEAQRSSEAGLFLGVSNYMGDLSPSPVAANETQFAFGGQYRHMLEPKFGLKGSVSYAKISGNDANKPITSPDPQLRGFSMEAGMLEFAMQGEYHILGVSRYDDVGIFNRQFSPFIGLGLALTFAEAEVDDGGDEDVRFPESDDTSTFITFPITLGVRFDITESIVLTGEFGLRATLSDYLDGISQNGNPGTNDHYFLGGISINYMIEAEYGPAASPSN